MNILYYYGNLSTMNAGLQRYNNNLLFNLRNFKENYVFEYPEIKLKQIINKDHHRFLGWIKSKIRDTHSSAYSIRELIDKFYFKATFDKEIDIIHHTNNHAVEILDKPSVLTVHDLSWIRYPEAHPKNRVVFLEKNFEKSLRNSHHIVTPTNFIKNELISEFSFTKNKTSSIWHGIDHINKPLKETCLIDKNLKFKKFILYVGTIEPRKNIKFLLKNYFNLDKEFREKYPLVIIGDYGWGSNSYKAAIEEQIKSKKILWLKNVSDQELYNYTKQAALLVYCSRYEGFGFPPIEALANGTFSLVPRIEPFIETIDNYGDYYLNDNDEDFKNKIFEILNRENKIYAHQSKIKEKFKWSKSATAYQKVFENVLSQQ